MLAISEKPSSMKSRRNDSVRLAAIESMVDEARARFHLGDPAAARDIASRVLVERPRWLTAQVVLVACTLEPRQ